MVNSDSLKDNSGIGVIDGEIQDYTVMNDVSYLFAPFSVLSL